MNWKHRITLYSISASINFIGIYLIEAMLGEEISILTLILLSIVFAIITVEGVS